MKAIGRTAAVLAAAIPALSAMACVPPPSDAPDKSGRGGAGLRNRAEELWTAKVKEDWSTVFRFNEPAKRKDMVEADFISWSHEQEPLVIRSYQLQEVLAEAPFGWVKVEYLAGVRRFPGAPAQQSLRWEKWQLFDGDWYPVAADKSASLPEPPTLRNRAEEDALRRRFAESWEARRSRDWHRLYELIDPRDKPKVSEGEFTEVEALFQNLSHEVHWVEVIGERGRVSVSYENKITDPSLTKLKAGILPIMENWVKVDGQWYLDLQQQ